MNVMTASSVHPVQNVKTRTALTNVLVRLVTMATGKSAKVGLFSFIQIQPESQHIIAVVDWCEVKRINVYDYCSTEVRTRLTAFLLDHFWRVLYININLYRM
jgi:hypothetical protein